MHTTVLGATPGVDIPTAVARWQTTTDQITDRYWIDLAEVCQQTRAASVFETLPNGDRIIHRDVITEIRWIKETGERRTMARASAAQVPVTRALVAAVSGDPTARRIINSMPENLDDAIALLKILPCTIEEMRSSGVRWARKIADGIEFAIKLAGGAW
jgi:hypothetical protein